MSFRLGRSFSVESEYRATFSVNPSLKGVIVTEDE